MANYFLLENPIRADEAIAMVNEYTQRREEEAVKGIMDYIQTEPWKKIRETAATGLTICSVSIGYRMYKGTYFDNCHTDAYGMKWLNREGIKLITQLFESFGYHVSCSTEDHDTYIIFYISWAG